MLQSTSYKQFESLCQHSSRVVVQKEIYADLITPVAAFLALTQDGEEVALLDSSDHATVEDACVYLALDPMASFEVVDSSTESDVFSKLREFYQANRCIATPTMNKFAGGMIGFISYDAVRSIEKLPSQHINLSNTPDFCFTFYTTNIVFDKRSGKAIIAKNVVVEGSLEDCYQQTMQAIDDIIARMLKANYRVKMQGSNAKGMSALTIKTDVSDKQYQQSVVLAKKFITEGEAFQIVLSRKFYASYQCADFDIYRALRVLNPSPYQFFLRYRNRIIVGSSPEKFLSLRQGVVESMPIAGTRPRGETAQADDTLAQALLEDVKETAEHMMLVDLGRNDIGRIAVPGSVKPTELKTVHRFSRVMHLVSRVQGKIAENKDAFDVLRAAFPAGTLTGAPKIRAMQIIDELETSRRGLYGGAICVVDHQGQLDSCITIRTAQLQNQTATVRAGAGIVLDSDPKAEADETRHKAQAVFDAIALAEEGLV